MEYRSYEIKAGCLVISSIVLLVVFLIVISGLDLFKDTKTYIARFRHSNGLEVGSLVRYGGMEVGRVKELRISPQNNSLIEFVLEIDADTPIKEDSQVIITSIGIMGEYYIEISTGSPGATVVADGSALNCKDVMPLMMLTESVDKITEKLSVTIDGVNQLLASENQTQIQQILVNINKLLENSQESMDLMMANMSSALANINSMGERLDTLLLDNQDTITRSLQQLELTLENSQELMKNLNHTMDNVDQLIVTQNGNYDEIMENIRQTSKNLDDFTRLIKDQPWSLVRKSAPKERKIQ